VDNKAVENAVCILRNLSYRLEAEVAPEVKYGAGDDWRSRGLGGGQFRRRTPDEGKKKKKGKGRDVRTLDFTEFTRHCSSFAYQYVWALLYSLTKISVILTVVQPYHSKPSR
jgi:hypothetical protein